MFLSEEEHKQQKESINELFEQIRKSPNENPIELFKNSKAASYGELIRIQDLGEEYIEE